MTIIGIDPGKRGALASLYSDDYLLMPLQAGRVVDVGAVQDWLIQQDATHAYIERQQARGRQAGQGLVMENFGRLTAVLDLCGVPYTIIDPKVWQGVYGVGGDKLAHVRLAQSLGYNVPMTSDRRDASYHDGVADAFLIGYAGDKLYREAQP